VVGVVVGDGDVFGGGRLQQVSEGVGMGGGVDQERAAQEVGTGRAGGRARRGGNVDSPCVQVDSEYTCLRAS
jgi:hypothetical protein